MPQDAEGFKHRGKRCRHDEITDHFSSRFTFTAETTQSAE